MPDNGKGHNGAEGSIYEGAQNDAHHLHAAECVDSLPVFLARVAAGRIMDYMGYTENTIIRGAELASSIVVFSYFRLGDMSEKVGGDAVLDAVSWAAIETFNSANKGVRIARRAMTGRGESE